MRAAPAAVAALLITTVGLTACGSSGGSDGTPSHADQIEVCQQATLDAERYIPDIRSNIDLAQPLQSRSGDVPDPFHATYITQIHSDVSAWRQHTTELEAKDITPELRQAMDTLMTSLEPLETQTENSFAVPTNPDSTMEVYRGKLDTQLCK